MVFATRTSYQSASETFGPGRSGDDRRLDGAGAVDEEDLPAAGAGRGGRGRNRSPFAFPGPERTGNRGLRDGLVDVAGDDEERLVGTEAARVFLPEELRRRLPDRLAARRDDVVRVVPVDGRRERLRSEVVGRRLLRFQLVQRVLLRELDLGGREGGSEGDRGDEVEEPGRSAFEGAGAKVERVGTRGDAQVAAERLELLRDLARRLFRRPLLEGRSQ